jgi:putative hydrolase of the HAD superfamily
LLKIKNTGIQPYFDKIFMAEVIGYRKPDKRFFEYAIKSVHAHKTECLMIGDDLEADIIGANNTGIDQVFFNIMGHSCDFKPTWEIRAIPELMKIL